MSDEGRERLRQMPEAQVRELARLGVLYPGSIWHRNECGCCACLHPGGDPTKGYVVGPDGESSYHETAH